MRFKTLSHHRKMLIIGIGLSLTACESAVITGTGITELDTGAAVDPGLLMNGGFEAGETPWESCSTAGSISLTSDASAGAQAINLTGSACLYQNLSADANSTYRLRCDTKSSGEDWSSVTMAFLDQNAQPLETHEKAIDSDIYATVSTTMKAPPFTSLMEVLFYSDGSATVDNCSLEEVTINLPTVELANGSFDAGLAGWEQCQSPGIAETSNGTATLSDGACIYQTIDVCQAVAQSPDNQPMPLRFLCDGITKSGNGETSLTVTYLDENYQQVAQEEIAIVASMTSGVVLLEAPGTSIFAEVRLFSEATTSFSACSITNR